MEKCAHCGIPINTNDNSDDDYVRIDPYEYDIEEEMIVCGKCYDEVFIWKMLSD